jgi:hypothetical protein
MEGTYTCDHVLVARSFNFAHSIMQGTLIATVLEESARQQVLSYLLDDVTRVLCIVSKSSVNGSILELYRSCLLVLVAGNVRLRSTSCNGF